MQCIFIFSSLFIFRWPHSFLLGWCLWWFHCAMSLELLLLSVSSWACLMGASSALWLLLPSSSLGLRMSPRPLDFCLASCQCLWQLVHPSQVSAGRVCSCKCVFMFPWLFGRVSHSCITCRALPSEVFPVCAWEDTGNLPGAHEILLHSSKFAQSFSLFCRCKMFLKRNIDRFPVRFRTWHFSFCTSDSLLGARVTENLQIIIWKLTGFQNLFMLKPLWG